MANIIYFSTLPPEGMPSSGHRSSPSLLLPCRLRYGPTDTLNSQTVSHRFSPSDFRGRSCDKWRVKCTKTFIYDARHNVNLGQSLPRRNVLLFPDINSNIACALEGVLVRNHIDAEDDNDDGVNTTDVYISAWWRRAGTIAIIAALLTFINLQAVWRGRYVNERCLRIVVQIVIFGIIVVVLYNWWPWRENFDKQSEILI